MLVDDLSKFVIDSISADSDSSVRIPNARNVLLQKPSRQFLLGSLADSPKDEISGESLGQSEYQSKTALRHNSLKVSFLIADSDDSLDISVEPEFSVFYRAFPNYQEQHTYIERKRSSSDSDESEVDYGWSIIWQRIDDRTNQILVQSDELRYDVDFSQVYDHINKSNDVFRFKDPDLRDHCEEKHLKNKFDLEWLESDQTYDDTIDKLKKYSIKAMNWNAEIIVNISDYSGIANTKLVEIQFVNKTKNNKMYKYEPFLFNCVLKIGLKKHKLIPFDYEYDYEGFQYDYKEHCRCVNCHAIYDSEANTIKSQPYAVFNQQKKRPRTATRRNNVRADFQSLSQHPIPLLNEIKDEMRNQLDYFKKQPVYGESTRTHYDQYKSDVEVFEKSLNSYSRGIKCLVNDADAEKSFKLMNETFLENSKGEYNSWRLFQIVFIVKLIPDIIDQNYNRDYAELLHVNTGGGKSEAYFGIIIFTLFWDRIRGKNAGVSAITKFPLRMLSIQQFQRIAKVVAIADKIRADNLPDTNKFSIGYYVGTSDRFPRYNWKILKRIRKASKKGDKIEGLLMDNCPFCDHQIILKINESNASIEHYCENCRRTFLLYFTNEEIYRLLPSFLVCTVDKMAGVALNRRFKNILGAPLSKCPKNHGYIPCYDKCEHKVDRRDSCDCKDSGGALIELEGPTLMIQDEMHLIREGFGTIDAHFEGLLNTLLQEFSNKEFKYIVLTATVSGVKHQINHLYGKDVNKFPGNHPRTLGLDKDFYFEYPKDNDGNIETERLLFGLKPNMRDNQYATLLTIYHICEFLKHVNANLTAFATKYGISENALEEVLKKYQCLLTYHGKIADCFDIDYFMESVVTSKLSDFTVEKAPLTGNNTLEEIKDVIKKIKDFSETHDVGSSVYSTFATNVVSHGVDLDEWNVMIFQGMTRNTAEYIQALSRAGRKDIGIIFNWYYPTRVRDLSFYKNFHHFHERIQHKVRRTPISRWTKLGFKQTFTSLFCGAILNYMSVQLEMPLYSVEAVNEMFSGDFVDNRDVLIEFLKRAYYVHLDEKGSEWYEKRIPREVEERLNYLETYSKKNIYFFPNALKDCEDPYYKTQYGMRGIQDEVALILNYRSNNFVKRYKEDL